MRRLLINRAGFAAVLAAGLAAGCVVFALATAKSAAPPLATASAATQLGSGSHCSPVAYQPSWVVGSQVKSYGGVYCPGGSSHSIGFNLYLLECTTTDPGSCSTIDTVGFNYSSVVGDYTLGSGNSKPCSGNKWYRSKSRVTVTLVEATSAAYDMC